MVQVVANAVCLSLEGAQVEEEALLSRFCSPEYALAVRDESFESLNIASTAGLSPEPCPVGEGV